MRRFNTWTSGLRFDGVEKTGVFAADIRTGTGNDVYTEGEVRAHDIFSQIVRLDCVVNRCLEELLNLAVLAADVDITVVRIKHIACNRHAFDDAQRVLFQKNFILKGARFTLVRIADDVLRATFDFVKLFPFFTCRIGSAASSKQFCVDDLVDNVHRRHIHRFFQSGKTAACKIICHRIRADLAAARC